MASYDYDRLLNAGITTEDAVALRRISMTLHRWHEQECGDGNNYGSWCIVRGKKTGNVFEYEDEGKPFLEYHSHTETKATYRPLPDRERGALKRLAAIMGKYPTLGAYVQTDPRGCALYIGIGLTDSNYSSQGIAVCR
jgi:hypothetical protein